MTYTFFSSPSLFRSATQFNEAKRWFESATVLCRFVPDGVAKAEKVRDRSRPFHPRYHHHPRAAPYELDPEGTLVRQSSERTRPYVSFRYRSTCPPLTPRPSGTYP